MTATSAEAFVRNLVAEQSASIKRGLLMLHRRGYHIRIGRIDWHQNPSGIGWYCTIWSDEDPDGVHVQRPERLDAIANALGVVEELDS